MHFLRGVGRGGHPQLGKPSGVRTRALGLVRVKGHGLCENRRPASGCVLPSFVLPTWQASASRILMIRPPRTAPASQRSAAARRKRLRREDARRRRPARGSSLRWLRRGQRCEHHVLRQPLARGGSGRAGLPHGQGGAAVDDGGSLGVHRLGLPQRLAAGRRKLALRLPGLVAEGWQ